MLDRTPLYAESGGQIADVGTISGTGAGESARAAVTDVQKIAKTLWVHRVNVESGEFVEGDTVVAAVDPDWRRGATQGHSGTHMVHAALRQVLGPNAVQAGSLNRPGYLRFDFNWQGPLTDEQRTQIEEVTNEAVQADFEVHTFTEQLEKAKAMGAMALFGEAYPDEVRVVEIGGPVLAGAVRWHARAQLGPDRPGDAPGRIVDRLRGPPGGGLRRAGLVPPPGQGARADGRAGVVAEGAVRRGAGPGGQPGGPAQGRRERTRTQPGWRARGPRRPTPRPGPSAIGNVRVVAQRMSAGMTAADLRSLVGDIRGKLGGDPAVVALIAEGDGHTVPYAVAANAAAQDLGIRANDLVKQLAVAVDGRGGGKADLAQGSGKDPTGIDAALDALRAVIARVG